MIRFICFLAWILLVLGALAAIFTHAAALALNALILGTLLLLGCIGFTDWSRRTPPDEKPWDHHP